MRKILLSLSLLIGLLLLTSIAYASSPAIATGDTTIYQDTLVVVKVADGNTFLAATDHGTLTGDWVGSFTVDQTGVVHPSLETNFDGTVTCDPCTVAGETGTLLLRVEGKQEYPGGPVEGKLTVLSGTGDLASLHAEGTEQGTWSGGVFYGTYALNYHFDP